jgi:hypothetical protein
MTTTLPAPTARPGLPRPLWERGDLFREAVYPEGLGPLEDEDPEGEGDDDGRW